MSLSEYIPKDDKSSYSGCTLNSGESDVEDITHSDFESEYIPSETSEDRDFIVSDSESLACVSNEPSDTKGPSYTFLDDVLGDVMTEQCVESIKPLKAITKRTVNYNGRQVVQYLVIWYSWETAESVPH
ncbi:hypothetical protein N7537_010473 [Penicillium hordei]|uniref:Uncharacterized protein n=1 Tax=Penicillium hordei TaxID=40994 RepID=A0AAD6DUP7_9EURO|nr:uncharacterized protein N7537_010473 [Penicillium hordei]KAJ5593569.1 hypothetical protein N7537_010473 [Penicillium hordei]